MLPIVLYNGAAPWTARTALHDLIDPDLPPQLHHWQPQVRYLLLEECSYAEADLAGLQNLAAAVFCLKQSHTPADVERVLAALLQWFKDPAQDAVRRDFAVWLNRVRLPARMPGAALPNLIELQELHAMLAERVKTWTEEWRQQGLEKGRQEGRRQGASRLLRSLLQLRFGPLPPEVDERLTLASEADLARWAERILTSQALAEVFDVSAAAGTYDPES